MPDGTEAIISQAIADHSTAGTDATGSLDLLGNETFTDAPISDTTDTNTDTPPVVADPVAPTQDDIDKILEAEGIRAPKQGERENRIPYGQTKKIIANQRKKWDAEQATRTANETRELTEARGKIQTWERAESLALTDPDKYLATLATLNPAYQKFLKPLTDAVKDAKADSKDDPEPQPTKMPDGSFAWTPENFAAHTAWVRRQAVNDANAAMEAKYGKLLKKQQDAEEGREAYEARVPIVKRQMELVNNTYGVDMVTKNQDAIIAAMQAAEAKGLTLTIPEATAQVLVPLMRAEETVIRTRVMEELKARPAAARKTVPGASIKGEDDQPVTGDTEGIINAALANFRSGRATA